MILDNEENTGVLDYCDVSCSSCHGGKNMITLDTNCIDCSEGYSKTEDSNTNCISENLIPENYYKNPNDNIYYHCYPYCKKCSDYFDFDTNNMNCLECIDDYYFIYGTNNCYNKSIIGFYIKDNELYPCEENCETCSDSKTNIDGIISNNCLTCDKTKNLYLLPDLNNCEHESLKEKGYYLKSIDEDHNKKFFINVLILVHYVMKEKNLLLLQIVIFIIV